MIHSVLHHPLRVTFVAACLLAAIPSCGDDDSSSQTTGAANQPQTEPAEEAKPKPAPAPAPEPPPPSEAQVALEAGRYDDVCAALVAEGVSEAICSFLADRAGGERGSLTSRALERFLRGQEVRKLRGRVVELYGSGRAHETYEVRVGRRPALLETTRTSFETTGRFTMWAQRTEDETMVMADGSTREVPVYLEWGLADDLIELTRMRSGGEAEARSILEDLVTGWAVVWRHPEFEVPDPEEQVSEERRQECRRYCFEYRDCMQAMGSHMACEVNINSRCRACREEGAHR